MNEQSSEITKSFVKSHILDLTKLPQDCLEDTVWRVKPGGLAESDQVEAGTIMVVLSPEIADVGSWSQIVDGFFFTQKWL